MRKFAFLFPLAGTVVLVVGLCAAGPSDKLSVKTLPPVVVKTVPQSGDTAVDATQTKEIRVTFSKKMTDKSWSWSQMSKETALPIKSVRLDKDGKTCIATVDLKPGKTYVTWLNSERFRNFVDVGGLPSVPYLLVFETKPAP